MGYKETWGNHQGFSIAENDSDRKNNVFLGYFKSVAVRSMWIEKFISKQEIKYIFKSLKRFERYRECNWIPCSEERFCPIGSLN